MVRSAEITGHLISIDLFRDDLVLVQGRCTAALEENADLRSQQWVPDWKDRLAESDGDEPEMWH